MQGIGGINFAAQPGQTGAPQAGDPVARSLRKQLSDLKKQLGELSSDASLPAEEKARRQQELRQQILDLQNQIRQHQMDQRKDELEEKTKNAKPSSGQQTGLEAVISADSAVKHAKVQESTAARMEGRARVIKSEIKTDGGAIPSKLKELSRAEQAADKARTAQMQDLGRTNQELQSAAEAGSTQKVEDAKEKKAEKDKERQEEEKKAETVAYDSDGKPVLAEKEPRVLGEA